MQVCSSEDTHAERIERARAEMPDEEGIARMSAAFKAISEPSRLKILLFLTAGECCVYHIVRAVGGTQSGVSHQLRVLRDLRIVRARREGQSVLYSLSDGHIVQLLKVACAHLSCEE